MKPAVLLPLSLVLLMLAAGCGSSSSKSSGNGGGSGVQPASPGTSPAPAGGGGGTVTVTMANIAFSPQQVTVKVGQTVKWVNQDSVQHNVTSSDGTLKSPTFGNGGSFSYTPKAAGSIPYVCTIHPNMTATLVIK